MKRTSLPRLIAVAALAASFVTPALSVRAQHSTQSYLRNTPSEIEREDPRVQQIVARAEDHFKRGELNLRDNKREAARQEFDKAVDAVLESGMDVRSNPRLQRYYLELVERVYRLEVPGQNGPATLNGATIELASVGGAPQGQQVGFVDQKFEPSPLDALSKLVLNKDETNVTDDDVAKLDAEIKNTLDFKFRPHPLVQGFINYYQGRGRATMETGLRRSG
ncbi:MAG TPA: hypothetical protein VD968_12005, partial [Pyrinomonadaceae bacterium]|nr:hypothetical protein [Pyrinomonadaceae bacterium]